MDSAVTRRNHHSTKGQAPQDSEVIKQMETYQNVAGLIQRGLDSSPEAMRLVMLSIQAGYNLKAMEKSQDKKAG